MDNLTNIVIAVIAALGGGGLTSLLVIPYTRKKAKAEAERSVVDNYETYTSRIEKRLETVEAEVVELKKDKERMNEIIMTCFRCAILRQHPDSICPVQEAYKASRESKENE